MNDLMISVERVVRPVRAAARQKARMREELLSHLTAVYEQERAALGDDRLALAQAVRRLGDPAELTRELQATVGRLGRIDAAAEYWIGWRGGESGFQCATRAAVLAFLCGMVMLVPAVLAGQLSNGIKPNVWIELRMVVSCVFAASMCVVPLGLAYVRLRGAVCGGLGFSRSRARAVAWAVAAGASFAAAGLVFSLLGSISGLGPYDYLALLPGWCLAGGLAVSLLVCHARINGPKEIRHTEWECLAITE